MEESGHYYTVYFTSLAVGFDKDVAYRHALLAQMPDEVMALDAADNHFNECLGLYAGSKMTGRKRLDLDDKETAVANEWRYEIEFALHSLPGKGTDNTTSAKQREITGNLLKKESPVSLKFGLLLHRLGDTYAHSVIDDESQLYTVATGQNQCASIPWYLPTVKDSCYQAVWTDICVNPYGAGHGLRAGHDPDYPFLRPALFYQYLTDLYKILSEKVNSPDSRMYRGPNLNILSVYQIFRVFREIIEGPHSIISKDLREKKKSEEIVPDFIAEIRHAAIKYLGVTMEPYSPERRENQTLSEFIRDHEKELGPKGMDIGRNSVIKAVDDIMFDVKRGQR